MIKQCLSNKNEVTTVSFSQKKFGTKQDPPEIGNNSNFVI